MVKRHGALALSALLALFALLGLILSPEAAAAAAREGVELCLKTIVPSLFPFMVAGGMITELGLTGRAAALFSPLMGRLFGVSGAGCGAFFLGLTGGYPLGAVSVTQLYKRGEVSKSEAERLLGFCDNTGPAFIIGVAGGAVFKSASAGLFLYGVHILSAVLTGMLLCWRGAKAQSVPARHIKASSLPLAFSVCVKRSVSLCAGVCGFVVFFSVLLGLLKAGGAMQHAVLLLSQALGCGPAMANALLSGVLELGNGITALSGVGINAGALALCSFILSFGSLSVHAQAFAEIAEGGLSSAKHLSGKLLHGFLSALLTLIAYPVLF